MSLWDSHMDFVQQLFKEAWTGYVSLGVGSGWAMKSKNGWDYLLGFEGRPRRGCRNQRDCCCTFGPHPEFCGLLVLWPGIEPGSQQWKRWVLTTGQPRKTPKDWHSSFRKARSWQSHRVTARMDWQWGGRFQWDHVLPGMMRSKSWKQLHQVTRFRRIVRKAAQLSSFFGGRFFFMWTICKVFIEFVTVLLLFYVFWASRHLRSPTRDQTRTPCSGRRRHNHWATREAPSSVFSYLPAHQPFLAPAVFSWMFDASTWNQEASWTWYGLSEGHPNPGDQEAFSNTKRKLRQLLLVVF